MPKGDKTEVRLALDTDAANMLLELAGSPRKQGDFVSQLIRSAWEQQRAPDERDLAREIEEIKQRLARLETRS